MLIRHNIILIQTNFKNSFSKNASFFNFSFEVHGEQNISGIFEERQLKNEIFIGFCPGIGGG